VSARRLPLIAADGERTAAQVVLWQSHYFLAGREPAVLTVACRRDDEPVACAVQSASAVAELGAAYAAAERGAAHAPSAAVAMGTAPALAVRGTGAVALRSAGAVAERAMPAAAAVRFADDGGGSDAVAGDGVLTAVLVPGEQGFADFTGPLRVVLDVEAGGERGTATFALSYTGEAPATFTGVGRERMASGALEICVELGVREAGRYVLEARIDDATGETFGFLTFDDVLREGLQEACFVVWGKLVRDEGARAPFTLRDVEGLRLIEDAFPDRHTMATWEGRVLTTRAYAPGDFGADVWESETKARYETALRNDVERAADGD